MTFGFHELGSFCGRAQVDHDLLDLIALDRPTDGPKRALDEPRGLRDENECAPPVKKQGAIAAHYPMMA